MNDIMDYSSDTTITSCSSSPPSAKRQCLLAPSASSSLARGTRLQQRDDTTAANEDSTATNTTPITTSTTTTKMTMGNNTESIGSTTSKLVPVPQVQVLPVDIIQRRVPRELASLGDVSFAGSLSTAASWFELPGERRRRQTRSRSSAKTPQLLPPAQTGPIKTKPSRSKSNSRPATALATATGRNKTKSRRRELVEAARPKRQRRSTSSEAVVSEAVVVLSKAKAPASLPSSGGGDRRKTARATASSTPIPVVASTTRKRKSGRTKVSGDADQVGAGPRQRRSVDSTTCDDASGMFHLGNAVVLALLSESGKMGDLDFVKAPDGDDDDDDDDNSTAVLPKALSLSAENVALVGASETVEAVGKSLTVPLVRDSLIGSSDFKTKEFLVSYHPITETTEKPQAEEHHQASRTESVDPSVDDSFISCSESKTKEFSVSHHSIDETTEQLQAEEHHQAVRTESVEPSVDDSMIESKTRELSLSHHCIDERTEKRQAEERRQAVRTVSVDYHDIRVAKIQTNGDTEMATEYPLLSTSNKSTVVSLAVPDEVFLSFELSGAQTISKGSTALATASGSMMDSQAAIKSLAAAASGDILLGLSDPKTKELSVSHSVSHRATTVIQKGRAESNQALRTKTVEGHETGVTKLQTNGETESAAEHSLLSIGGKSTGVSVAVPVNASYFAELSCAQVSPKGGTSGAMVESKATVKSPTATRVGDTLIDFSDFKTKELSISQHATTVVQKVQGEMSNPTRPKSAKVPVTCLAQMKTKENKEMIPTHPENSSDSLVAVVPPDVPHHSTELSGSQPPPAAKSSETGVSPKVASKSLEVPQVMDSLIGKRENKTDELPSSYRASKSVHKFQEGASKTTSPKSTEAYVTGLALRKTSGEYVKSSNNPHTSTDTILLDVSCHSMELWGLQTSPMDRSSETLVQPKPAVKSPTLVPVDDSLIGLSESKTASAQKLKKETSKPTCPKPIEKSVSGLTKMEASGEKIMLSKNLLLSAGEESVASSEVAPPDIFVHSAESSCLQSPQTEISSEMGLQPKVTGTTTVPLVNDTSIDSSEDNTNEPTGADRASALGRILQVKRAKTEVQTPQVGISQARLAKPFETPCANVAETEVYPDDDVDRATASVETPKAGTPPAKLVQPFKTPCANLSQTKESPNDADCATTSTKTPPAETPKAKVGKPFDTSCVKLAQIEDSPDPHHATIPVETPKAKQNEPPVAPLLDVTKTEEAADSHCAITSVEPPDVGASQAKGVKPSEALCADITKKSTNEKSEVSIETPLPTKLVESDYRFQPIRAKEPPVKDTCANVVQESKGPTSIAFDESTRKFVVKDTTSAALVASITPDPLVVGDFSLSNTVEVVSDQDMADFVQDTLSSGCVTATQLPELWDTQERGFLERFYVSDLDTMCWEGTNLLEDPTISCNTGSQLLL
jgi:hypothetical protein